MSRGLVVIQRPVQQPVLGQCRFLGRTGAAARTLGVASGVRRVEVQLVQGAAQHLQAGDERQLGPQFAADHVALEVPGNVLADFAQGFALVPERLDHELGVPVHALGDLAQVRPVPLVAAFEARPCRSPNSQGRPRQPRPTTTPSHAGLADHPDRVLGGPDVAVAEHRDVRQRLAQPGDGGPVGLAGVELCGGAAMQGDGGDAGIAGDPAGVEVGEVVVVDALAHLDGHRDIALGRLPSPRSGRWR